MLELSAALLGAIGRRYMGWGGGSRWVGKSIAMLGCVLAMWGHDPWAMIACAVLIPWVGFTIPLHGETINHPQLMALRNAGFTFLLAVFLEFLDTPALLYAPVGLFVGLGYYWSRELAPEGDGEAFYDGWNSAAELCLGGILVGGLLLI